MSKKLTDKQYVGKGGCVCPVCQSEDISGEHIEVDAGGAWQEINCGNCGATWNDVYKLVGYSELEVPEDE